MTFECNFPGKEADEEVIFLLRRHWIAILLHLAFTLILALIPLGLFFLGATYWPSIFEFPYREILLMAGTIYILVWLIFLLIGWIDYYFDVWIITNKRIIDVEQISLFSREVSESSLDKIQDVTAEVKGVFETIFHFGTIELQTAGTRGRFTLPHIPNPYEVRQLIAKVAENRSRELERMEEDRHRKSNPEPKEKVISFDEPPGNKAEPSPAQKKRPRREQMRKGEEKKSTIKNFREED